MIGGRPGQAQAAGQEQATWTRYRPRDTVDAKKPSNGQNGKRRQVWAPRPRSWISSTLVSQGRLPPRPASVFAKENVDLTTWRPSGCLPPKVSAAHPVSHAASSPCWWAEHGARTLTIRKVPGVVGTPSRERDRKHGNRSDSGAAIAEPLFGCLTLGLGHNG
jgi:hypothetical protein